MDKGGKLVAFPNLGAASVVSDVAARVILTNLGAAPVTGDLNSARLSINRADFGAASIS